MALEKYDYMIVANPPRLAGDEFERLGGEEGADAVVGDDE